MELGLSRTLKRRRPRRCTSQRLSRPTRDGQAHDQGSSYQPGRGLDSQLRTPTATRVSGRVDKAKSCHDRDYRNRSSTLRLPYGERMTPEELQSAVEQLFRLNNYDVAGPLQLDGASVDIRATPRGGLFPRPVYVEVTVQRVDVAKFGKDLTKFHACRMETPECDFLVVSSSGFTEGLEHRAPAGVRLLTYDQLFAQFERFAAYERAVLTEGRLFDELERLAAVYEEPEFADPVVRATEELDTWLAAPTSDPWLIVVGEYGTGKTALSKILLRRWMEEHKRQPERPVPVRIELRDFVRQFDAVGLLHRFLDQNGLGHVPVDFFYSLIRQGRIVLILDGYDEMAQYMHIQERRVCLEALAELGRDGARGLLTSRPNYFSEAEELTVLETLYSTVHLEPDGKGSEAALDELFERHFVERRERRLRDLTPAQTATLVERRLGAGTTAATTVISLLEKVARPSEGGNVSLSGKPVIISYLVDLADTLSAAGTTTADSITEYQCFGLIIDKLMQRDRARAGVLSTAERRLFLQSLASKLSTGRNNVATEDTLLELIEGVFEKRLQRIPPQERQAERQRLLADLRSSATLTRRVREGREGWEFSHNSLREFLVIEHLLQSLDRREAPRI